MNNENKSFRDQLTVRAMVIGALGSVVLTGSSMFVALKASSLPWPILFVALVSLFCLKGLGNTNVREITVAHTAMSAGSMVAGGLAFTIPGIFILNPDSTLNFVQILLVTVGGTVLGLIFTALLRKHYIDTADMPYPMGEAAAEVVTVGDEGNKGSKSLFAAFGFAGIFTALRDWFALIPAVKFIPQMSAFGSLGGFFISPMMLSIGYLIGPLTIGVWFLGACIGDFGILIGGQSAGLWDQETASGIKSSLGLGWMVGVGIAIIAKEVVPKAKNIFGGMIAKEQGDDAIVPMRWSGPVMLILAVLFIFVLDLPVVAVIITLLGVWLTTAMSSQCVGQSGINPMEVFGIFVMAIAKAACSLEVTQAVFVAAIVAIAAGLTGDVMNDFKSGRILKTDPKAQWIAEAIGGIIGAFVAVVVIFVLVKAYGGEVFGSEMFPAAQAAAVASVVGGIANLPVFIGGLVASFVIYFITPAFTMLGLGIYLPAYLSFSAALGGLIKVICDKVIPASKEGAGGRIIASGLLAGEGFIGIVIAIIQAVSIIKGL